MAEATTTAEGLRKDIQGLRAVAVALVVVYHLWPATLPGGFVGVDVFFVISGFLITGHLWREFDATGRIDLAAFWARRARRLLPASLFVLLVCMVGTALIVPLSLWPRHLKDYLGAGLYSLNWVLALDSVDYSAAEDAASPVQHFWSLSVEEQFYLAWPVLLVVGVALAQQRRAKSLIWCRGLLGGLVASSLALSVLDGFSPSPSDYFVTQSRVWEFGAGALLALAGSKGSSSSSVLAALGSGSATIGLVAVGLMLDGFAPFPGWLALLPVGLTLLGLRFGESTKSWGLGRMLGGRPVQWIGDHSYGIYLWHWPLIVFAAELPPSLAEAPWIRWFVVPLTLLLAALSKRYLEDPIRFSTRLQAGSTTRTFSGVAMAMGFLAVVGGALQVRLAQAGGTVDFAHSEARPRCFGPYQPRDCKNSDLDGVLVPEPAKATKDHSEFCWGGDQGVSQLRVCEGGATENVRLTTALVGDSHAAHFGPFLLKQAISRGEKLISLTKQSCPYSTTDRDKSTKVRKGCDVVKSKIKANLENPSIRRVVLSAWSKAEWVNRKGQDDLASAIVGYEEMLRTLPDHILDVIVLRDLPQPRSDVIQCLDRLKPHERLVYGACARARTEALIPDPLAEAARNVGGRVRVLDFTDAICDQQICSPVAGHVLVYRDTHHITRTFAESLAPYFEDELALGSLEGP